MKRTTMIALITALVLGLTSVSYGGYLQGFEVVGVTGEQVTIKKGKAEHVQVPTGKDKFKVGDKVSFDPQKLKLRIKIEGC
ncbi:MAG: hypothetical protein KAV87_08760 [Desulfobacteraceae bacterium]|nr:hypothetical protein [Desulfobacteraceae bacterium]